MNSKTSNEQRETIKKSNARKALPKVKLLKNTNSMNSHSRRQRLTDSYGTSLGF